MPLWLWRWEVWRRDGKRDCETELQEGISVTPRRGRQHEGKWLQRINGRDYVKRRRWLRREQGKGCSGPLRTGLLSKTKSRPLWGQNVCSCYCKGRCNQVQLGPSLYFPFKMFWFDVTKLLLGVKYSLLIKLRLASTLKAIIIIFHRKYIIWNGPFCIMSKLRTWIIFWCQVVVIY